MVAMQTRLIVNFSATPYSAAHFSATPFLPPQKSGSLATRLSSLTRCISIIYPPPFVLMEEGNSLTLPNILCLVALAHSNSTAKIQQIFGMCKSICVLAEKRPIYRVKPIRPAVCRELVHEKTAGRIGYDGRAVFPPTHTYTPHHAFGGMRSEAIGAA